jgi:tetratricopeptide (TPR) repeat protein
MVREIVTALETISDTAPLLLIFEDLQWVDQATVDLLSALARRRVSARLIVVGTTRPVDPAPQENSLLALQQDLQIHGLCHGVELESLDHSDVAELLAAGASRETLPSGFSDLIHRQSGGNPLFIEAALDHFLQRGFLSRNSGTWQIEVALARMEREVPENLRQMIDAQISRLSKEEQRALEAASIVGTTFASSTAAEALDASAKDLADVYDELSKRRRFVQTIGSLQWPDGTRTARYQFVHSLYPEVLYQRQSPGRRTLLHRRVGGHLEDRLGPNAPEAASELANHFDQGADWARAVKYWRLAADTAVRRHAPREAVQLLERAFDLTDSLPVAQRDDQRIGILQTLAPLYVAAADVRAIDIYERLAETAARCGALDVHVQTRVDLGFFLSWMSAERAIAELNSALKLSEKQSSLMQSRTRMSSLFWRSWIRGWDAPDVERCRSALADIRAEGDSPAPATHLMEYSFIQWASSEYRAACHTAEESVAIVLTEGNKNPYVDLVYLLSRIIIPWSLLFAGDWGRALRETANAIEIMEKNQASHRIGSLRLIDAWIHLEGMDFLSARTICESMLSLTQNPENAGRSPQLRICLILAGSAAAALGETDRALEHLRTAAQAMDREMVIHDWYWRMLLESAFAEAWLVRGDLVKAKSHAERYLVSALETAERTWQARAWESVARIALAEGDLPRARDRLLNALAAMNGVEVPLAEWRVHGTAAELEQLTRNTGAAERHRELSRAAILKIANSLGPSEPLRAIFLSAPPVAHILGSPFAG